MKIAVVVEQEFFNKHVGVRNLIFTLYTWITQSGHSAEFIYYKTSENSGRWIKYSIHIDSIYNNFAIFDRLFEGLPKSVYREYYSSKSISKTQSNLNGQIIITELGEDLDLEMYDVFVLSAPWLSFERMQLNSFRMIGIVYDTIANEYVLDSVRKPFHFAKQQLDGFKYYINNCESIISISKDTFLNFEKYFSGSSRHLVMPPAVPNYLLQGKFHVENNIKSNAVILAGPFDPRKGIEDLPKILNQISSSIDTLYIYGAPRCDESLVKLFFYNIVEIKKVVWYETASSSTLLELYGKSKVLIFLSDREGLGLPLIEAQMQGCRVVCTPFKSSQELLVDGFYVMKNNFVEDVNAIRIMLDEPYDYGVLKQKSIEFFDDKKKASFITNLFGFKG